MIWRKVGSVIRSFAQSDFVKMAVVLAWEYLKAGGKVG